MEEESKTVKEVAKTTGKIVDASREMGAFISRFVSGPLQQGAGIVEDWLTFKRWERQSRLIRRADEMLAQSGLSAPSRQVSLKLAMPIIQGALLEDDDELQDRWAALLINAANANFGTQVRRYHLDILNNLSRFEAQVLDLIYSLPFEKTRYDGVITAELPKSIRIPDEKEENFIEPSDEIILVLSNLTQLGCLRLGITWGGGESFKKVNTTVLGHSFVNACRKPKI